MNLAKTIKNAPREPGVYLFKNARGKILYIGKASNLHARLQSYLRPGWKEKMLKEAASLSWNIFASDIEALIRESILIKAHAPRYNILFRDDKNYFYVAITHDEFPRIFLTHRPFTHVQNQKSNIKNKKDAQYIGPFTDGISIKRVLQLLRRAFPYCTCKTHIRHKRKCVNGEIGKCLALCCAHIPYTPRDVRRYRAHITAIKKILLGASRTIIQDLEKKMARASTLRAYEKARAYRDQRAALTRVFAHSPYLNRDISGERGQALCALQKFLRLTNIPERIECYDISHHQGSASVASMVVFLHGMPHRKEYRKFIMRQTGIDDFAMMREVLTRRFMHDEWPAPNLLIIDGGKGHLSAVKHAIPARIPFMALAKREEELFIPNRAHSVHLTALPHHLAHLLTALRDEAHRYAISFHRSRHRHLANTR